MLRSLVLTKPSGRQRIAALAIGLLAWGLVGVAGAQPRPDVTSWVRPDTVQRGEPFTLIVTANTPAHRAVGFPEVPADSAVFAPLTVLRRSRTYTRRVGGMYAIDSVAYTVTTAATDSVRIPPLPIRIDAGVGTLVTRTRPHIVRVTAPPVRGFFEGGPSTTPALRWGVVIAVLIVGVGGGIYLRMRPTPSPADDRSAPADEAPTTSPPGDAPALPAETARRLEELESSDLTSPEAVKAFYVELAAIVRTVLGRQLDVSVRERTTADLVSMLDRRDDVPPSAAEPLRSVLGKADLVKYAGQRPGPEAARESLRTARTGLTELCADRPSA